MLNKFNFYLLLIFLIAGVLRFFQLDTLPPSLEWDEVATGYDAYSILKTGKDQYGNFLPLTFRSLDDYKPPLYTYMTALSISVFGWNDFAVRFPAAFLGTLAVISTFFLTQALFNKRKLSLITALLLAISPWDVLFCRLGLETNCTIFFTTSGVWLFLQGLKHPKLLIISALFFGFDLYLYHNARVFIPLLGIGLIIIYRRELWHQKFYTAISLVILSVFLIRLIPIVSSIQGQMRFKGTSIFNSAVPLEIATAKQEYSERREVDEQNGIGLFGKAFHNVYVMYSLRIFENYLTHFNPAFWLFTDDNPRHHMPEMGIIYFIELPLLLIGFYFLFKEKNKQGVMLIVLWFLLAPVASSVTLDVPHALRSEIFLPVIQIVAAIAMVSLGTKFKSLLSRKVYFGVLSVVYLVSVSFFLHKYLFHYSRETSQFWQYGRKEAVNLTEQLKSDYEKVVISPRIDQAYIFWLYHSKYDPGSYQRQGGTISGGWAENRNRFDKYEFHELETDKRRSGEKVLFVGLPKDFSPDATILKKIYYLNGEEAIWVVKG